MSAKQLKRSTVIATVHEVFPTVGLAVVVDDFHTEWALTKAMQGPGLDAIQAGQRLYLTLDHHAEFSLVRAYQPQP